MNTILNFENWTRLNESAVSTVPGQTAADLAALDQIQLMADRGPTMAFGGASGSVGSTAQPETLITSLAGTLNTGYVTKTITFTAMDQAKKWKIKADFFGKDGKLHAIVYQDGKQVVNGPVTIKNHGGWKQIIQIGQNIGFPYVDESGAQQDGNGKPAPIAAGLIDIVWNIGSRGEGSYTSPYVSNVPRGTSNVKFSAKSVELTNFMNAEIAKRAKTTPAPSKP
jgi:hypothetical protein